VSTPGLRRYVASGGIPRVLGGLGIAILTTSSGIMTDREARKSKVGGEVMCMVW
jgi:small subunit ribosomal protein S8